ncbi:MAG: hypothetical protein QXQ37_00700 [Nitrososphaerota archaeon]
MSEAYISIKLEDVKFEKADDNDEFIGYIEGIASTTALDLDNERFSPEFLEKNVEKLVGKPIRVVHGKTEYHLADVGKVVKAWMENGALKIKAGIFKTFPLLWEAIKSGFLKMLSIGGIIYKKQDNVIEDGEITEISLTPKGKNPQTYILSVFGKSVEMEIFQKVDYDLPIVEREKWDADAAKARIFKWAEKEDGTIDKSKASKLFLVVEGDGSRRGDYGWPVGDIVDGKPVLVTSAIKAAIIYASGARGVVPPREVKAGLARLVSRLKKEGYLPEDYELPWEREESAIEFSYPVLIEYSAIEKSEKSENKPKEEKAEAKAEIPSVDVVKPPVERRREIPYIVRELYE